MKYHPCQTVHGKLSHRDAYRLEVTFNAEVAIRSVSDIMGEISAASSEQSAGVAQIGEAVTHMDQATQQNAALVEESAAAAGSLQVQASQLVQAVAVFKLATSPSNHAAVAANATDRQTVKPAGAVQPGAARPAAKPAKRVNPLSNAKLALSTAHGSNAGWENF